MHTWKKIPIKKICTQQGAAAQQIFVVFVASAPTPIFSIASYGGCNFNLKAENVSLLLLTTYDVQCSRAFIYPLSTLFAKTFARVSHKNTGLKVSMPVVLLT